MVHDAVREKVNPGALTELDLSSLLLENVASGVRESWVKISAPLYHNYGSLDRSLRCISCTYGIRINRVILIRLLYHISFKNCERSEILPYLQASTLACQFHAYW